MERYMEEQEKRFENTQKEFGGKLRKSMEGLSLQSASSGLRKGPKRESVVKQQLVSTEQAVTQTPGLTQGSDDRGLGAKNNIAWGKQSTEREDREKYRFHNDR